MKRKLFTFSAGLSTLLCVVLIFVGITSFWRSDLCGYETQKAGFYLACDRGTIEFIWVQAFPGALWRTDEMFHKFYSPDFRHEFTIPYGFVYMPDFGTCVQASLDMFKQREDIDVNPVHEWRFLGVHGYQYPMLANQLSGYWDRENTIDYCARATAITFPALMGIAVSSLLPIYWYWSNPRRRRAKRIAAGLCPECGYDLRASKVRCPECGTPVPNPVRCPALLTQGTPDA